MSELRRCRATTSLREQPQSEGGGEVFLGVGSGGDQSKQPVIAFRSPDVLGGLSGPRHGVLGSSTEQRCEQIDTVNKLATGFAFCLLPPPPPQTHTKSPPPPHLPCPNLQKWTDQWHLQLQQKLVLEHMRGNGRCCLHRR